MDDLPSLSTTAANWNACCLVHPIASVRVVITSSYECDSSLYNITMWDDSEGTDCRERSSGILIASASSSWMKFEHQIVKNRSQSRKYPHRENLLCEGIAIVIGSNPGGATCYWPTLRKRHMFLFTLIRSVDMAKISWSTLDPLKSHFWPFRAVGKLFIGSLISNAWNKEFPEYSSRLFRTCSINRSSIQYCNTNLKTNAARHWMSMGRETKGFHDSSVSMPEEKGCSSTLIKAITVFMAYYIREIQ